MIRGVSALLVCAGHLRSAIMADYGDVQQPGPWHALFYLLTGFGHQAVMVFFVLSGFFVGGSVLRQAGTFSAKQYAIARLTRLWIVLIPALVFTAVIDSLVRSLDAGVLTGAYWNIWNSGPQSAESFSDSFGAFMGNCAFLQTIVVPVFGVNGPLWSLANEFWYYVLFPCLACSCLEPARFFQFRVRLWAGLCGLVVLALLPRGMCLGFLVWLLGVVVWRFRASSPQRFHRRLWVAFGLLFFLAAMAYSKSAIWQLRLGLPEDLATGLTFGVLAVSLAWTPVPQSVPSVCIAAARRLADFSYSLYIVHFPVVLLIAVGFYHSKKMQPDLTGWLQWLAWFCTLLLTGLAFWWCFEKRTETLRRLITSKA